MDREHRLHLDALCLEVVGQRPDDVVSFSTSEDGTVRRTWRVHVGARILYATQRKDPRVTEREAALLRSLGARGAPVPACLALEHGWLLQENAGESLAQRIHRSPVEETCTLLQGALRGLATIHDAGHREGLAGVVPVFARGAKTSRALLQNLEALERESGLALPDFDRASFQRLVGMGGDAFIKWDARPANAGCDEGGRVRWFDWQHANRRHRSDDLIWLLCDEFVPEEAAPTELLFDAAQAWSEDLDRVAAMAIAHVGVRLRGCLTGQAGLEASWEDCLAHDWLGSTKSARRLARRGAAIAPRSPLTTPLESWFLRLARRFDSC